jgi:anti-sigma regulatory factor (Ser/Thr protein kinase)
VHVRHWFDGKVTSVPAARHWLVDQLMVSGRDHRAEEAAMCVSELAANAVDHTHDGFEVALTDGDGTIRVAVTDCADETPQLRPVDPAADRGRGLLIVDSVASRWGVESATVTGRANGKTVWFELD